MAIHVYECKSETKLNIPRNEHEALIRSDFGLQVILAAKTEYGSYSSEVIEAVRKAKERADMALKVVEDCGWVKEPVTEEKLRKLREQVVFTKEESEDKPNA